MKTHHIWSELSAMQRHKSRSQPSGLDRVKSLTRKLLAKIRWWFAFLMSSEKTHEMTFFYHSLRWWISRNITFLIWTGRHVILMNQTDKQLLEIKCLSSYHSYRFRLYQTSIFPRLLPFLVNKAKISLQAVSTWGESVLVWNRLLFCYWKRVRKVRFY